MSEFGKVDVKEIVCDIPRSRFPEDKIQFLAHQILEHGNLLRPLIVTRQGIDNYLLIDGYFEYYAAVRAREQNPRQAEMVNAFVLSPKEEASARQQVSAFQKSAKYSESGKTSDDTVDQNKPDSSIIALISSLETRFNHFSSDQLTYQNQTNLRLDSLESSYKKKESDLSKTSLLDKLNTLDQDGMTLLLARYGVSGSTGLKMATSIWEARQKKENGQFNGFREIVDAIKGIGASRMLTIIDRWIAITR